MYKSLKIKNFRGFKDLEIENVQRVNLIAGLNNVGKTALLWRRPKVATPIGS